MITVIGVYHVGLQADDPRALAAFYRDAFGVTVTATMRADDLHGRAALLSSRPAEENHKIGIVRNERFTHVALKVASLEALQCAHREIMDRGVPVAAALNRGFSLSFYVPDPTGHLFEVYWATGVETDGIHAEPVDLTLPARRLLAQVHAVASAERATAVAVGV